MKENQHETKKIQKLAKKLKVDRLTFKDLWVNSTDYLKEFQPEGKEYKIDKRVKPCLAPFSRLVINWQGLIFPCCSNASLDKKNSFGSVVEKSFKNVWSSKEYTSFRKTALKNNNEMEICKNCTLKGVTKNKIVLKSN